MTSMEQLIAALIAPLERARAQIVEAADLEAPLSGPEDRGATRAERSWSPNAARSGSSGLTDGPAAPVARAREASTASSTAPSTAPSPAPSNAPSPEQARIFWQGLRGARLERPPLPPGAAPVETTTETREELSSPAHGRSSPPGERPALETRAREERAMAGAPAPPLSSASPSDPPRARRTTTNTPSLLTDESPSGDPGPPKNQSAALIEENPRRPRALRLRRVTEPPSRPTSQPPSRDRPDIVHRLRPDNATLAERRSKTTTSSLSPTPLRAAPPAKKTPQRHRVHFVTRDQEGAEEFVRSGPTGRTAEEELTSAAPQETPPRAMTEPSLARLRQCELPPSIAQDRPQARLDPASMLRSQEAKESAPGTHSPTPREHAAGSPGDLQRPRSRTQTQARHDAEGAERPPPPRAAIFGGDPDELAAFEGSLASVLRAAARRQGLEV